MTVKVSCVDVGQGDCTVAVDGDTGEALVIDCREGAHGAAVAELQVLGFSAVTAAIVSHSHMDHFGGLLDVVEAIRERFTGVLYLNDDTLKAVPVAGPDRLVAGRRLRALLNRAREYPVGRAEVPRPPGEPPQGQLGGSLEWRLLSPTSVVPDV